MEKDRPETIEAYIALFPDEVRDILERIHETIRKAAPGAEESISYGMPAFKTQSRPLVYFAAFQRHIGLYALPTGTAAFAKDFAPYKSGKGSVQFPLDKPMPYDLITKVVQFRVKENLQQAETKPARGRKKAD